ncbi:MAG: hypothetical protein E6959_05265, partial [Eikenella corrodens]|nr:hypothetical protein [Eikenella corrodens]
YKNTGFNQILCGTNQLSGAQTALLIQNDSGYLKAVWRCKTQARISALFRCVHPSRLHNKKAT